MLITVWGDREKISMAGRQGMCMERSRALLMSVCSDTHTHTHCQQPSAHAHADNEDRALAVKTRTGGKDDTERGRESTGWFKSFQPVQERERTT